MHCTWLAPSPYCPYLLKLKKAHKLNIIEYKLLITNYLRIDRAAPRCAELGLVVSLFFGRFCVVGRTFPYS